MAPKAKSKIVKDVAQLVLSRRMRTYNVSEYKDPKVVHQKYASLFFVCGISPADNEFITLEIIHRYVEFLDRYCGDYVCELDQSECSKAFWITTLVVYSTSKRLMRFWTKPLSERLGRQPIKHL